MMLTMIATFWHEGIKSPWSPDFNAKPLSAQVIGNVGIDLIAGASLFYK